MKLEYSNKMLEFIEGRVSCINDSLDLITDQQLLKLITISEYEKRRKILAKALTALELEKKIIKEYNESTRNS